MTWPILLLVFVTLQRLGELILARRNTQRLIAKGAVEIGADHYPTMIALHAAWLAGLWFFAPWQPFHADLALLYMVLQLGRAWVIWSLGERWTTRILILPGAPLVRRGPYRFISHPNYVVVVLEIALLPLVYSLVTYAVVFTLLNAVLLYVRIKAEGKALASAVTLPR